MSLAFEGIATIFNKPVWHKDHFLIFRPGAFDLSLKFDPHPKLLQDHRSEESYSNERYPLELHATKEHLIFRYIMPDAASKGFADFADDFENYLGTSIGFVSTKETVSEVDGFAVKTIHEALLREVSILNDFPAVDGTYCRIVDIGTKDSLDVQAESGVMASVGKFIALHRKAREIEAGGKTARYGHSTPTYQRKADITSNALERLYNSL